MVETTKGAMKPFYLLHGHFDELGRYFYMTFLSSLSRTGLTAFWFDDGLILKSLGSFLKGTPLSDELFNHPAQPAAQHRERALLPHQICS
jgi:hypothetical protein